MKKYSFEKNPIGHVVILHQDPVCYALFFRWCWFNFVFLSSRCPVPVCPHRSTGESCPLAKRGREDERNLLFLLNFPALSGRRLTSDINSSFMPNKFHFKELSCPAFLIDILILLSFSEAWMNCFFSICEHDETRRGDEYYLDNHIR